MDRKYLRKKVIQILKDANIPEIGQDVFGSRSVPTNIDLLPVILVYSNSISVDRFDESPKRYLKEMDITIEIITQHDNDEDLADEMDDISIAVENAIEDSIELELETEYANLKSIINKTDGDGQSPIGSSKITYTIGYVTEPRSGIDLPELGEINTIWQMNGNEDNDSQDSINLGE